MLKALFGPSSLAATLKRGLGDSMAAHRLIAEKVAGTLDSSSVTAPNGAGTSAAQSESSVELDMATLADVQLRYEAEARLLHLAYQSLRTSIRGNG